MIITCSYIDLLHHGYNVTEEERNHPKFNPWEDYQWEMEGKDIFDKKVKLTCISKVEEIDG